MKVSGIIWSRVSLEEISSIQRGQWKGSPLSSLLMSLSSDKDAKRPLQKEAAIRVLQKELDRRHLIPREVSDGLRCVAFLSGVQNGFRDPEIVSLWGSYAQQVELSLPRMNWADISSVLKAANDRKASFDCRTETQILISCANELIHRFDKIKCHESVCELTEAIDDSLNESEDSLGEIVDDIPTKMLKSYLRSFAIAAERDPEIVKKKEIRIVTNYLADLCANHVEFSVADLSAVLWALAGLGERRKDIYDNFSKKIISHPKQFDPIALYHIMWSYSFAGQTGDKETWKFLIKNLSGKGIDELPSDKLCTLIRAIGLATAGKKDRPFLELVTPFFEECLSKVGDLSRLSQKDIAQLAIACAKIGQASHPCGLSIPEDIKNWVTIVLRDHLVEAGESIQDSFFRSCFWSIAWFKKDMKPERRLFLAAADRLRVGADKLPVDEIATMIWSMCRMRCRECPADVVLIVSKRFQQSLDELTPATLSGVLFAFSKMGVWCDDMGQAIAPKVISLMSTLNSAELSSVLWAYAVGAQLVPELVIAATEELLVRPRSVEKFGNRHDLSVKDEWVSKWSLSVLLDECPSGLQPFSMFENMPGLKERNGDFATCSLAPVNSSLAHTDISKRLGGLGVLHENEAKINGVVVDIAMPSEKVALEIDGPWHFVLLSDGSQRYDGPTQWKHRKAESTGWKVVNITTKDYELCKNRTNMIRDTLKGLVTFKAGGLAAVNEQWPKWGGNKKKTSVNINSSTSNCSDQTLTSKTVINPVSKATYTISKVA